MAIKVAEVVRIFWPTGTRNYSWWSLVADSVYDTLSTWINTDPIPIFIADDPTRRFHEIIRSSAIGDDVVGMVFQNNILPGLSLRYDASNDYYSITAAIPSFPNTMMCWVNFNSVGGSVTYSTIFALNNSSLFVALNEDRRLVAMWDGIPEYTGSTLELDRWYHIAVVSTSGSGVKRVYVDGEIDIEATEPAPAATGELFLGSNTFNQWADARFSSLKIWTAALTQDQIKTEMEYMPAELATNLWFMNDLQVAGLTLADYSGGGHDFEAFSLGGSIEGGRTDLDNSPPISTDGRGFKFERMAYVHRGGVRVEFFYFFPEIDGGLPVSWFTGHLRTPDRVSLATVEITAATGFRSANLLLPNRPHAQNCTFYFGGELTTEQLVGNPCDYDRHLSGSVGTLDGSDPWTFCEHTSEACLRILGDKLAYGGDETVTESTLIGSGEKKTVSTTVGNETRLKDPKRVIYGERKVRALHLLAYAKELNPSSKHQDKGTLRTLFEVSEGRVQSISNVRVRDGVPQGLITKTGSQRQSATIFSPSVGNYNRTAHFQANLNPIDPRPIQVSDIFAECDVVGRDEIKVYSNPTTFVQQYTNNRSWCLLDLLTNNWYGHRIDPDRYDIDDFIYLAGKNSTFNCDVQGTRSAQQQIYDICLAGLYYLPFNYNGVTRILPVETVDTSDDDVPTFTDVGPNRNILYTQDGLSRIDVRYKDDDAIPNSVILTFEDAEHDNIERPLLFEDWQQQYRAGKIYGDNTKRKVEQTYAAYGTTNLDEAVTLGTFLRDGGPFGFGGIQNNLEVDIAVSAVDADALNLHETKVIKIVSDRLDGYKDPLGNPFEFFIIKSLRRTPDLDLIVTCQALFNGSSASCDYVTWTNETNGLDQGYGTFLKTSGFDECFTDASGSGDAGGRSVESIASGDWELRFNFGGGVASDPQAMRFDDASDMYIADGVPSFPNTVMCWVYLSVDRTVRTDFIGYNTGGVWALGTSNGTRLQFEGALGTDLSLNTWYHVAIVSAAGSGAARTVYLNGESDITTTGDQPTLTSFNIAAAGGGDHHHDGRLAAIKVWERALTEAEIEAEMNFYAAQDVDNLWAQWGMQTTGLTLTDESGNGHDLEAFSLGGTGEDGPPINASGSGEGSGASEGRVFGGVTTNAAFTANYTQMRYCIHVSDQLNTVQGYDPHTLFIYEAGAGVYNSQGSFHYASGDDLIIRSRSGVVTYYWNGGLIYTSALSSSAYYPLYAASSIACLQKTINETRFCTPGDQEPGTGGGTEETQDAAPSAVVIVDRLISDAQQGSGVLGFNFGAAPTNTTDAWGSAVLNVDRGGGYIEIAETEVAAAVGEANTVLPGTTTGSETVRVDIQPGQELESFSSAEVTAGRGFVFLGGEIFQYEDAVQISSSPNRWELSTLSNRGARCTAAFIATHATGEDFLSLDDSTSVIFASIPSSEIGLSRNYKIVTAGEDIGDVTSFSFTFNAPNFVPVTPADYDVQFDGTQIQVVHTWTPISDICLVVYGLMYEIYEDVSGSPGPLLWSGTSSEWREPVTAGGTRTYHFRAKNNYANGNYVMDSVTFTLSSGTGYGLSGYGSSYGM